MSRVSIHGEIKSYIASRDYTLTKLVSEMNKKRAKDDQTTIQNISNKLTRGTIKYSEVLEIAEILGMEITWK